MFTFNIYCLSIYLNIYICIPLRFSRYTSYGKKLCVSLGVCVCGTRTFDEFKKQPIDRSPITIYVYKACKKGFSLIQIEL